MCSLGKGGCAQPELVNTHANPHMPPIHNDIKLEARGYSSVLPAAPKNMEGNFGMEALCGMFEELNLPSVKTVAHAPCPTCELHTETLVGTEIDPVADTSLIQAKNLFFKVMTDSPATL